MSFAMDRRMSQKKEEQWAIWRFGDWGATWEAAMFCRLWGRWGVRVQTGRVINQVGIIGLGNWRWFWVVDGWFQGIEDKRAQITRKKKKTARTSETGEPSLDIYSSSLCSLLFLSAASASLLS
jgi:hypothetical protein